MANETRVNLKHLLEDIRDSYPILLEEVIITELVANALDSGASRIELFINPEQRFVRFTDNGRGMKRNDLREYHNIAASTKTRGTGIGFAGIGAKLSLLVAERVFTETKGGHGSRAATEWRLTNPFRAPWKFVPFMENVSAPRGTAVTILLADQRSPLLNPNFAKQAIIKHYYSLMHPKIFSELLKFFYRKEVTFYINGQQLKPLETDNQQHWFRVYIGKTKKPLGVGYLIRIDSTTNWLENLIGITATPSLIPPGLSVSTFGKVIKNGWEWTGLLPKNHAQLAGIIEVPALAELLTTNKSDFLKDAAHLKKYYRYRKAIQEAVLPILHSLGEPAPNPPTESLVPIKPLTRQIENALEKLVEDFPELGSLVGVRRRTAMGSTKKHSIGKRLLSEPVVHTDLDKEVQQSSTAVSQDKTKSGLPLGTAMPKGNQKIRVRQPGLKIVLQATEDEEVPMSLGRIIEDILTINTRHPAWNRANQQGMAEYHILLTTALVLSDFLEAERSPQEFIGRFLEQWGLTNNQQNRKLF